MTYILIFFSFPPVMFLIMYYTNLILAVIVLFSSSLPSSWSTDHNTVHSLMGRKKKAQLGGVCPTSHLSVEWKRDGSKQEYYASFVLSFSE